MKIVFFKNFLLFISVLFITINIVYAQSCNTLKEIFENSDFCDGKWISLHGRVYEGSDIHALQVSKFQITDDGINIIRVVSQDELFLYKDDEVIINGNYHKKLNVGDLNLDDAIIASKADIKVILTGEEYFDLFVNYIGKGILKNESLQKRSIILAALIPLFVVGAVYFSSIFYERKQFKGRRFEGYIEDLFRKNKEWKVERDNSYRKLSKGWVESYSDPDFVFIHRRTNKKIAVECKYKPKEYERIFWAFEDQIEHYQNFSDKEKIPVFIIIGIGGKPKNPKTMFFVPLSLVKYPEVKMDYLQKFKRDSKKYFSLDNQGKPI